MMAVADKVCTMQIKKGTRSNLLAVAALGAIFGLVVVLFFVGETFLRDTLLSSISEWFI